MSIWLPYGLADASVLFRHPLTTAFASNPSTGLPDGAIVPYTTRTIVGNAAGPTYDPIKGITGKASGGSADSGISLRTTTLTAAQLSALDVGGQITLEIERDWVTENGVQAPGSVGYTPASNQAAFSTRSVASATGGFYVMKQTSGQFRAVMHGASTPVNGFFNGQKGTSLSNEYHHSIGMPDFVKVNIGWLGGTLGGLLFIAVDDLLIHCSAKATALASIFERLELCADTSNGTGYMNGYYMRNLQIASKPIELSVNAKLRHVGVFSDSIVSNNEPQSSTFRDAQIIAVLSKQLAKRDILVGTLDVQTNAGKAVFLGTNPSFKSTGVHTTFRAKNCPLMFFNGGTNDVGDVMSGATTEAEFKAAYTEYLEYFLGSKCPTGIYGYTADLTATQLIICNTVGPRTGLTGGAVYATSMLAMAAISQWIRDIVSGWGATYPAAAGRVKLCDVWADNNGPNFPSGWLNADEVHPAAVGTYHTGISMGNALLQVLATSTPGLVGIND